MSAAAITHQPNGNGVATEKVENEWTILVFFAGEENISPAMTAQLKAIKDAGFEKHTTVLIHYDPNKRGVGTVTFDINTLRKKELGTSIGDGRDPFVRNLIEDIIPGAPKGATAEQALKMFLKMGVKNHRAKHYAVVLVGHGMVVGNDAFLPDNSPETAITLKQMGKILHDFKQAVEYEENGGVVELIGLHSCSMSAVEVVYELKGAARYLMATEGISFVGSWPYRQLMKKILNSIDEGKKGNDGLDVDRLIMSVQRLALHNSTDFMFSGISADLCLCSLDPERVDELNDPLRRLSKALKAGLETARGVEVISLAHLKAQSYWQETYTDLFDFCLCLAGKCNATDPIEKEMAEACKLIQTKLKEANRPDGLIVQSDFIGPLYQYSHGLSVYFPWAPPVEDIPGLPGENVLDRYNEYKFTKDFQTCAVDDSWLSFLRLYFAKTLRTSRAKEDNPKFSEEDLKFEPAHVTALRGSPSNAGGESLEPPKTSSQLDKTSSQLFGGVGGSCGCTIKNYPMEFPMSFMLSQRASEDPNPKSNGSSNGSSAVQQPATVGVSKVGP